MAQSSRLQVTGGEHHRELGKVLRAGRAALSEGLVEELVGSRGRETGNRLWVAAERGQPRAAAALVECPGRTALFFLWPVDGPLGDDAVEALASTATSYADASRVAVVESLLETADGPVMRGLSRAGFFPLAELVYMQRPTHNAGLELDLPDSLIAETHSPRTHELFARAIVASYEQTRDCPGLVGLRSIEDIIAGHRGTGRHQPELWLAIRRSEQAVGVMLLNLIEHTDACELVYLGLALPWRGRGLGRRLLAYGLSAAREFGVLQMMLAVDRQNEPALHLYRSMDFTATTSRFAWLKTLR